MREKQGDSTGTHRLPLIVTGTCGHFTSPDLTYEQLPTLAYFVPSACGLRVNPYLPLRFWVKHTLPTT